jgi:hypothetical protein
VKTRSETCRAILKCLIQPWPAAPANWTRQRHPPLQCRLPARNFGLVAFKLNAAIACEQERREDAKKALGNGKFGSGFVFTCEVGVSDFGAMAGIALFSAFASSLFNCRLLPRLGPDAMEAAILAHPGIGSTRSSQRTRQGKQHPVQTNILTNHFRRISSLNGQRRGGGVPPAEARQAPGIDCRLLLSGGDPATLGAWAAFITATILISRIGI